MHVHCDNDKCLPNFYAVCKETKQGKVCIMEEHGVIGDEMFIKLYEKVELRQTPRKNKNKNKNKNKMRSTKKRKKKRYN